MTRSESAPPFRQQSLEKLGRELHKLELRGKYDEANTKFKQIESLKISLEYSDTKKRASEHERHVVSIRSQERQGIDEVEKNHFTNINTFERETDMLVKNRKDKQKKREMEIRNELQKMFKNRTPKYSSKLQEMNLTEKSLCAVNEYLQAKHLQKAIQSRIKTEERNIREADEKELKFSLGASRDAFEKSLHAFISKRQVKKAQLNEQLKERKSQLKIKFRNVLSDMHHCYELSSKKQMNPLIEKRDLEKRMATLVGAATIEKFEFPPEITRPKTAGSTRKKPEFKNEHGESICDSCKHPILKLHYIPKDYKSKTIKGIGCFCCWECASIWNKSHSPTQHKWIRQLLIEDAKVKQEKRQSKKVNRVMKSLLD